MHSEQSNLPTFFIQMKNHQGQHLNDVKKLVLRGESLDSFADHFL